MSRSRRLRRSASWLLICLAVILTQQPRVAHPNEDPAAVERDFAIERVVRLAQATEDLEKDTRNAEVAEPQSAAPKPAITAEQLVAALKLRAQKELARRRARKWSLSTVATWTVANESNPNLSKSRSSAVYTEEYLSSTFSYKLHPQLTWQAGYSLDALHYNEFTDLRTLTNTLTTKLLWRFVPGFRAEAHYTFDDSDYPYDDGASTWDQKVHLRLRQSVLKNYYHYVGWTYLNKQYKDKFKRDGAGTRIPGKRRQDQRDTMVYELGGTVAEVNTLKLRQEFYFNDSNESNTDYNDAQNYKIKLTYLRDWDKRWSTTSAFTYDYKQYEDRSVSEKVVAQRDNTKTYDLGLTYKMTPNVDLAYTWKYKKNDSNDPAQAYQDITNSLALTASF